MTMSSYGTIEMHLGTTSLDEHAVDLPKRYGRLIREVGGEYMPLRGYYADTRFVKLPPTLEGTALAVELLRVYRQQFRERGRTVILGRTHAGPCSPTVHTHAKFDEPERDREVIARLVGAMAGTYLRESMERYDREQERKIQERAERPARLREERDRLLARLDEIDRELAALRPRRVA